MYNELYSTLEELSKMISGLIQSTEKLEGKEKPEQSEGFSFFPLSFYHSIIYHSCLFLMLFFFREWQNERVIEW